MVRYKKTMKYLFYCLMIILACTSIVNPSQNEQSDFKLFLSHVIAQDAIALKLGYDFLSLYPHSPYVPDVNYYLTFIEKDYFKNIINLKKVIVYYPYSLWRESALIRLLTIYLLRKNDDQFFYWYDFYQKNYTIKNNQAAIEIIYLKMLYTINHAELASRIAYLLKNANNYDLLAFCLYLKGMKLSNSRDELIDSLKLSYFFFPESDVFYATVLQLYKAARFEEKPLFAKALNNNMHIKNMLSANEQNEVKRYADSNYKIVSMPDDESLKRDYYFISLGFSKDENSVDAIVMKLKNLGFSPSVKMISNKIKQIYIGYFHFKKDAALLSERLNTFGIANTIQFIDYSF